MLVVVGLGVFGSVMVLVLVDIYISLYVDVVYLVDDVDVEGFDYDGSDLLYILVYCGYCYGYGGVLLMVLLLWMLLFVLFYVLLFSLIVQLCIQLFESLLCFLIVV